ncbi:MAG TPA: histidine kinase, partial [Chitinophagaceae bacterium]
NRGQVWMPNGTRVSVLAPDVNTIYDFSLPLEDNTVGYYNSIENLHNGNILLSVYNELVEFKPQQLNIVPAKRKPQISLVNVSGKDYIVNGNSKQIFKADENTMRFQFGILTDKEFFPYDLEYMLEGAENKWTVASGSGKALYNNLAAGTYSFRVRAKGKNNAWQTEETVFNFSIKSPFYKALWFWLVIAALLIATLMFFYRFRLNKQKQILTLETKAQQLEKEKTIVMYENLKQQLNPHFLFNSLTSLSGLIETDQQVAGNFLEQMSGIYRYILKNGDNETVFLKDEIEFAQLYINLQQTRFKNGLQVNINVPEEYMHYKIAPVTLQNLIENAIKHNIIDSSSPLVIDIFIEGDYLVVKNNLQKKNVVETSNKKGLEQFASLYKYLSTLPVIIEETNTKFQIKIPLI